MTKQMTITLRDWVYDTYLSVPTNNMSAKIENLIIKGAEAELDNFETNKAKLLDVTQQNKGLLEELRKLKLLNDSLKAKLKPEDSPELARKKMMYDSLRYAGYTSRSSPYESR